MRKLTIDKIIILTLCFTSETQMVMNFSFCCLQHIADIYENWTESAEVEALVVQFQWQGH